MNPTIKIGNVARGSRNHARQTETKAPAPLLSLDAQAMKFNVTWNGTPVDHWEVYLSENPPGNFEDSGSTAPDRLPTDYSNWISDHNVNWALYVVGRDGDENEITPPSNTLTGRSPA